MKLYKRDLRKTPRGSKKRHSDFRLGFQIFLKWVLSGTFMKGSSTNSRARVLLGTSRKWNLRGSFEEPKKLLLKRTYDEDSLLNLGVL